MVAQRYAYGQAEGRYQQRAVFKNRPFHRAFSSFSGAKLRLFLHSAYFWQRK
jgi:hypothetical protein